MKKVTAKELAEKLNGRVYRDETTPELKKLAQKNGLVIVYGLSDDLLELRGAINAEFGANDGTTARFGMTRKGVKFYNEDNEHEIEEYGIAITEVEAVWSPSDDVLKDAGFIQVPNTPSWLIKANIPHENFSIFEDNELYCVGIVFDMEDVKK